MGDTETDPDSEDLQAGYSSESTLDDELYQKVQFKKIRYAYSSSAEESDITSNYEETELVEAEEREEKEEEEGDTEEEEGEKEEEQGEKYDEEYQCTINKEDKQFEFSQIDGKLCL